MMLPMAECLLLFRLHRSQCLGRLCLICTLLFQFFIQAHTSGLLFSATVINAMVGHHSATVSVSSRFWFQSLCSDAQIRNWYPLVIIDQLCREISVLFSMNLPVSIFTNSHTDVFQCPREK